MRIAPFAPAALGPLTLLLLTMPLASCSFLLELEQCQSEADCSAFSQCLEGLCREPSRVLLTDHIVEDTTWTPDNVYVLENLIMVVPPAVLTIEPGTRILGRQNTGLVSLAGARLEAEGTRQNPIVFTSDKPPGQRLAGDWAGVAMVGLARTNRENFRLRIITDQFDTRVGGSDDNWNCGTMRYVRVEFGGSEVDGQKALNGITLAGCGRETTVEYVQSHRSDDDGIAVFGGTVDLRYAVSTLPGDDAFDLDTAWRGTGQFLVGQFDVTGAESLEIENLAENPTASPQTFGQIYNYTLIGSEIPNPDQRGIYSKFGGQGHFSHGIIQGFAGGAIFVEGPESAQHAEAGLLTVEHTLFFENGSTGTDHFATVDLFDSYEMYEDPERENRFDVDPGLERPYDVANPSFVPRNTQSVVGVPAPPEPFDQTAVYLGAFSPSANTPWTEGWTAFPRN